MSERRRLAAGRLVIATHNQGKLREFAALLAPFGQVPVSAGDLGLPEPEETAPDFAGNARLKARAAAERSGLPALADDSGFSVAALGGAPGVRSARWAGPGRAYAAVFERIERGLRDSIDRRASFSCALSLAWPDGPTATFLCRIEGTVAFPPRGENGFGYDPIFVPCGGALTFAEMTAEEKSSVSHRARAFAALSAACLQAL